LRLCVSALKSPSSRFPICVHLRQSADKNAFSLFLASFVFAPLRLCVSALKPAPFALNPAKSLALCSLILLSSLTLPLSLSAAAPPIPGAPAAPATNPAARLLGKPPVPAAPGRTNGIAARTPAAASGTNIAAQSNSFFDSLRKSTSHPYFYPAVAALVLLLVGAFALLARKRKPAAASAAAGDSKAASLPSSVARKVTVHGCNILQVAAGTRRLWQFDARGDGVSLNREVTATEGQPLPAAAITRSWSSLWQRKLNVAWLPPEQVFLRVIHLPASDFDETLSMVELQLEKLSPMPVNQVAWSIQILPQSEPNMQTVVAIIAARSAVETFLGDLEGQGYMPDRIEVPMLDQLRAPSRPETSVWIYPATAGAHGTALVAWWSGGALRNIDLLTLPAENRPASLKEQLMQMAWAGEMEGWVSSPPVWHLVGDASVAAEWEPALRAGLEQSIDVQTPLPVAEVAALTARRAAQADPRANLLPAEYSARYQQQFVDRLWMRGLGFVLALYVFGLLVYGVALGFASYRSEGVAQELAAVAPAYTNALQLKARYEVLRDRSELKFAALNCYKILAEKLPSDVVLESLNLSDGRKLTLSGSAPSDQVNSLIAFERDIRKAQDSAGEPLFDSKKTESMSYRTGQSPGTVVWSLSLELKRTEVE
jgi:hypothetical protein